MTILILIRIPGIYCMLADDRSIIADIVEFENSTRTDFHYGYFTLNNAQDAMRALAGLEPVKVWSLIVTLFGDRGTEGDVALSGRHIRGLLQHIGIRADTTRVALHRLRKEGWITTSKSGREVTYGLSCNGYAQTRAAYEDVYRRSVKYPQGWRLQLSPVDSEGSTRNGIPVIRNLQLVPSEGQAIPSDSLVLEFGSDNIPDWFIELVLPAGHQEIAVAYLQIIKALQSIVETCSDLDKSALRLLVLHHWRKMALRDSTWFHIWMFQHGTFSQCHTLVSMLLDGQLHRRA